MNENKLKNILQNADRFSSRPGTPDASDIAETVRRAIRQRRRRNLYLRFAASAAAVLIVTAGIWNLTAKRSARNDLIAKENNIEMLQTEVARLKTEVDSMQLAVRRAIEEEKTEATLDQLQAELASITDPIEELQRQVDRAAFTIVYQADRMYRDYNLIDSAIESYKRAIEFFPANKWAEVARNRLIEIQNRKKNKRKSNTFKEMYNANHEMFSSIDISRNNNLPGPC